MTFIHCLQVDIIHDSTNLGEVQIEGVAYNSWKLSQQIGMKTMVAFESNCKAFDTWNFKLRFKVFNHTAILTRTHGSHECRHKSKKVSNDQMGRVQKCFLQNHPFSHCAHWIHNSPNDNFSMWRTYEDPDSPTMYWRLRDLGYKLAPWRKRLAQYIRWILTCDPYWLHHRSTVDFFREEIEKNEDGTHEWSLQPTTKSSTTLLNPGGLST